MGESNTRISISRGKDDSGTQHGNLALYDLNVGKFRVLVILSDIDRRIRTEAEIFLALKTRGITPFIYTISTYMQEIIYSIIKIDKQTKICNFSSSAKNSFPFLLVTKDTYTYLR